MRRRELIALLGSAAAWPFAARAALASEASGQRGDSRVRAPDTRPEPGSSARAQDARKIPRIGILDFFPSAASVDFLEPFRQALRELGHVEGQDILVEYHSAEQRSERAAVIAADLVRREVDIIVAVATPAAHAAKSATATIPIVMAVADPLATGLVASLARPGGNLTGVSTTSPDLAGKRLQLLRELRPGLGRVAFLGAANDPNTRTFVNETQAAADSIGVHLQPLRSRSSASRLRKPGSRR